MSIINEINKDPLEFINKIAKKVVYNLVEKQINIKVTDVEKKEIKTVYDTQSILDLQYKKYYYPTMKKDEYIELHKDMYYKILSKIIDVYDLELMTVNILQKSMNINTLIENIPSFGLDTREIKKTKLEMINKENCSFVHSFYKTYNPVNKKEYNKYISITILKDKFDVIVKNYDNYIEQKYPEYYEKYILTKKVNIVRILKSQEVFYLTETKQKVINIIFYPYFEDYKLNNPKTTMSKDKYEKHNSFIFFTFFVYLIKNCASNYMSMITGIYLITKDKNNKDNYSNHRNMIIYQLLKDKNNKEKVVGIQYEPHGSNKAFSYDDFNIKEFYDQMYNYSKKCQQIDKDFPEFIMYDKVSVCPKGPQTKAGTADKGFCAIYSTFWYNCFINVIQTIKLIEAQYNIKTLSKIEMSSWIKFIDYHLVTIKKEYKMKYSDEKYDYDTLSNIKNSMIVEHYNEYIKYYYPLIKDYENYIKNTFYKVYKNNKITMKDFIEFYYKKIYIPIIFYKLGLSDNKLKKIMERKYTMNDFEYYNIFINYIYNLITFILSSKYFEKEKELLNKYSQKETINTIKEYIGDNNYKIVKFPGDNRDFIIKYEKEKYIHELYLEDYENIEKKSEKMKNVQRDKIVYEEDEEMEKIIKKLSPSEKNKLGQECSKTSNCGENLICDEYNQCNIDYNKQMIGDFCVKSDHCYSGYCNKDKICRKAIKYC